MTHYGPAIALMATCLVIVFILYSRFSQSIQDIPNERSLHSKAVPRTGGIGLLMGTLAGWSLMFNSFVWWLVIPLLGLFVVSILDDIYSLSVQKRLLAHLAAAAILVIGSGAMNEYGLLIAVVLFFFAVWMINLYNFMDGSDGLAGGMALFGFSSYGIAALLAQDDILAWANFTIAAAALGFLFFNFYPAKIFMGDAGSIPLGFLATAMGAWGWQQGCWAAWFPILVFSPFIVDATATLGKRLLRGARISEAHREHYYQRAIQMGWGHRKLALVEYALMMLVGMSALYCRDESIPWMLILIWLITYATLMVVIDIRWHRFQESGRV